MITFVGDDCFYDTQMRRICREAVACGIPLEINLLGMAYGKHYPNMQLWEVAAEEGCKAILGLDAHAPKHVFNQESEQRALDMVQQLGLELLETVEFRSIGV